MDRIPLNLKSLLPMHITSCPTCHWTTTRCQSLTAVALLCMVIAVQLAACGSTDANDEAGPSLEVSPSELGYGEVDTEAEAVITISYFLPAQ